MLSLYILYCNSNVHYCSLFEYDLITKSVAWKNRPDPGLLAGWSKRRLNGALSVPCLIFISLRAKLSGAVYCYRSCLWRAGGVCLWVCGTVTTITRNCVHRSSPNWVSSWLNFGRPAPPGRGSAAGRIFLAPYYSQCAVFASLWALFHLRCIYRQMRSVIKDRLHERYSSLSCY